MSKHIRQPSAVDLDENSKTGWINLFEAIPDAMLITVYVDGRILRANSACTKVYGYLPSEMIGKTTTELGIFQNAEQRQKIMKLVAETDFFVEFTYYDKERNPRFGLFSGRNVTVKGQNALVIIARDITDRKQMESKLEDAINRFHQLAKVTHIVPWETNVLHELRYLGPAIKRWGVDPEALLNMSLVHAITFREPTELLHALQKLIDGSAESYTECHAVTINNFSMDFEIRAVPIRDAFGITTGLTGTMQDVSRFVNTERELRDLASRDPVTNLYNRRGFFAKLNTHMKSRRRADQELLLLYIDLDDFKKVNDQLGHDVGDELLLGVANSLSHTLRTSDVIARIGGDEFIALLTNTPRNYAEIVCQRVLNAFAKIVVQSTGLKGVGASLGLALIDKEESVEVAVKRADSAMYRAKQSGKNQYKLDGF